MKVFSVTKTRFFSVTKIRFFFGNFKQSLGRRIFDTVQMIGKSLDSSFSDQVVTTTRLGKKELFLRLIIKSFLSGLAAFHFAGISDKDSKRRRFGTASVSDDRIPTGSRH